MKRSLLAALLGAGLLLGAAAPGIAATSGKQAHKTKTTAMKAKKHKGSHKGHSMQSKTKRTEAKGTAARSKYQVHKAK